MITITLRELAVEAAIGILDWELTQTQTLSVSCELQIQADQAAQSDNIDHTLDYAQLREVIQAYCCGHRYNLLETLASRLADHLLQCFDSIQQVQLELIKPTIFPDAKGVGVRFQTSR